NVAQVRVGGLPFRARRAVQPDASLKAIDVQRVFAEHLGEATTRQPTRQLHLPQAVLSVAEPLPEERIQRLARADVRYSPAITHDFDRCGQPSQPNFTVKDWQRSAQKVSESASHQRAGRARGDAERAQSKRHLFAVCVAGVFPAQLPEKLL